MALPWTAPPEVVGVVERVLEPGEQVVAAAPFEEWDDRWNAESGDFAKTFVSGRPGWTWHLVRGDGWNLLVLTTRFLRELSVVVPRWRSRTPRLSAQAAPLDQIWAVEIREGRGAVELLFGGLAGDYWFTSRYQPAYTLATELQRATLAAVARGDTGDQPSQLAQLRSAGHLSDEEWNRAKALYLGKPASEQERSACELRQLHALYQSGVLTESEFNMKKWTVLARGS